MKYCFEKPVAEVVAEFIQSSIENSFSVQSIIVTSDFVDVEFVEDVDSAFLEELVRRFIYISKNINKDLIFENNIKLPYNQDPMPFLVESGFVQKVADGMYMFQGIFLKFIHYFNDFFRNVAEKYNAVEQEYPVLWPVDLYKKINYFKEFPQQVILAAPVKENFEDREHFAESYKSSGDYDAVDMQKHMAGSTYGLQSAVCDTCYYLLKNQQNFDNTVYTTYNKVFRNEKSKIDSLDRLTVFSVRDIMFVGDEDFVLHKRQQMIDEVVEFFESINISCKIETANDPFFSNDSVLKNVFQYANRLKYEILAKLPFSDSYISVGSINLHLNFFGKTFNILLPDGSFAYSGCLGIGFERLVYALFCQFGHDVKKWPESIRDQCGLP